MEKLLREYALKYNNPLYFETDPIIFPKYFANKYLKGEASLQDVEISGIVATHLAWGRRNMIVRDCRRAFDEMEWQPAKYIESGLFRSGEESLHRTVKWSEFAQICKNLRHIYYEDNIPSIEFLTPDQIRTDIYGQKSNNKAANKKIHLFRRWMIRNDNIVDLGVWKNSSPEDLIIPLDVHVHRTATLMGITSRKSTDLSTALEITDYFKKIFPEDPCMGDFALFGYGVSGDADSDC